MRHHHGWWQEEILPGYCETLIGGVFLRRLVGALLACEPLQP